MPCRVQSVAGDPEHPLAHRAAREGGAVGDSWRRQVQGDAQCRAGRLGLVMCGRSCFDDPETYDCSCLPFNFCARLSWSELCVFRHSRSPRGNASSCRLSLGSSSWWASSLLWRRSRRVRYFVGNVVTTWHGWSSNGCRIQQFGEMQTGVHHLCTRHKGRQRQKTICVSGWGHHVTMCIVWFSRRTANRWDGPRKSGIPSLDTRTSLHWSARLVETVWIIEQRLLALWLLVSAAFLAPTNKLFQLLGHAGPIDDLACMGFHFGGLREDLWRQKNGKMQERQCDRVPTTLSTTKFLGRILLNNFGSFIQGGRERQTQVCACIITCTCTS